MTTQGGGPNIPVWANYLVLGTDYTSYATVFTCLNLGLFRSQARKGESSIFQFLKFGHDTDFGFQSFGKFSLTDYLAG